MDDIWVILGSIVLMVLSSLSSTKKKKGVNTSSVDTEKEVQESFSEEEFIPMEDSFSDQRQDINNIEEQHEIIKLEKLVIDITNNKEVKISLTNFNKTIS